jgi:glutamate synthase domain-containing protein 1
MPVKRCVILNYLVKISNAFFLLLIPDGSDSQMFDNTLEFLMLSGRSLPHAAMMMVPEPWSKHEGMDDDRRRRSTSTTAP